MRSISVTTKVTKFRKVTNFIQNLNIHGQSISQDSNLIAEANPSLDFGHLTVSPKFSLRSKTAKTLENSNTVAKQINVYKSESGNSASGSKSRVLFFCLVEDADMVVLV